MGDITDWLLDSEDEFYFPIKKKYKEGDSCPNDSLSCSGKLILRQNKKIQTKFLGCSEFPKCKFSTNI